MPPNPPDLIHYVELAQRGGFPEATMLTDHRDIRLWHDSYVEQLVNRDAMHTGPEIVRFDDNIVAVPIAALWGARA